MVRTCQTTCGGGRRPCYKFLMLTHFVTADKEYKKRGKTEKLRKLEKKRKMIRFELKGKNDPIQVNTLKNN